MDLGDGFQVGLPCLVGQIFHCTFLRSTNHTVYNSMYWPWLNSLFSLSETTHVLRNLLFTTHWLLKENKSQIFAHSAWGQGQVRGIYQRRTFPFREQLSPRQNACVKDSMISMLLIIWVVHEKLWQRYINQMCDFFFFQFQREKRMIVCLFSHIKEEQKCDLL